MSKAVVVYFSGYGHTKRVAQAAAEGAQASLVEIDSEGNIPEAAWDLLDQAQSILFGAPTYMGSVPWQFKKFADATSRKWFVRQWQDKGLRRLHQQRKPERRQAGFPDPHAHAGVPARRHLGQPGPGSRQHLGLEPRGYQQPRRLGRALVQSPSDADAQAIPSGDLETVKLYAARVARIGQQLHA